MDSGPQQISEQLAATNLEDAVPNQDYVSPVADDFVSEADNFTVSGKDYPVLSLKLKSMDEVDAEGKPIEFEMSQPMSIQLLYEARQWISKCIEDMQLAKKDVFLIIGASRTGKGTLLEALKGTPMKYFEKKNLKHLDHEWIKNSALLGFMAPYDKDGNPLQADIVSHGHNSHTFRPKLVSDPPQYGDLYCGLDKFHSIDYPGMFESRGLELDTALYLGIQQILLTAKSARVLVMVSAQVLEPEKQRLLTVILSKLSLMFKEPHKHLIIGLVKSRVVENTLGDREEILSVANGEDNEQISFKGFRCIFVEQDSSDDLQEMVKIVQDQHSVTKYVQKGFLDEYEVMSMFEKAKAPRAAKDDKIATHITQLMRSLEAKVPKPNKALETLLDEIRDAIQLSDFHEEQNQLILRNLKQVVVYQKLLKEEWDSLAFPSKVKSIIGLLPEYKSVERMLADPKLENPSVATALYEIDAEIAQDLRVAVLVLRRAHFADIKAWIASCGGFLSASNKNELGDECSRLEQRYDDELDHFGLSQAEQDTILAAITKKLRTPLRVLGYAGRGFAVLYEYFRSKVTHGDQKARFDAFKKQIDQILYEYIKTDLIACENTLTAVAHRQARVRQIVARLKEQRTQCQQDMDDENLKQAEEIFKDGAGLASDEALRVTLFGEGQEERIVYSCLVQKRDRWQQKKNVILTVSDFGRVSIVSEEKRVHWALKLSELKSLTWVYDDKNERHEIVINHKTSYDYRLDCMSPEEKESAFRALKYIYWLRNGVNLPIYAVPLEVSWQVENTKRAATRPEQRKVLPEKYRAVDEDIYLEDPQKSQLHKQQQELPVAKPSPSVVVSKPEEEQQPEAPQVVPSETAAVADADEAEGQIDSGAQAEAAEEGATLEEKRPNIYDMIEQQQEITAAEFSAQAVVDDEINLMANLEMQREKAASIYVSKQEAAANADAVSLKDFAILRLLGKGACAKIFLVEKKGTGELFAMKTLRKDFLLDQGLIEHTIQEKSVLESADHPFIVGMKYCFATDVKIYFIMKFYRGGELYTHLLKEKKFAENRVRRNAVQIALALGHLHNMNVIYRDLKMENIVVDETGYLALADFGLSRKLEGEELAHSYCGTPEYIAPEIFNAEQGYGRAADWWALGIVVYEMFVGCPPFFNGQKDNRKLISMITTKAVFFPTEQKHGIRMSPEAKDFISRLLDKGAETRLGAQGGLEEVLAHPWLKDVDVEQIKAMQAPIDPSEVPALSDDRLDLKYIKDEHKEKAPRESLVTMKQRKRIAAAKDAFAVFDS